MKKCKLCKKKIDIDAKVCNHCGSHQKNFNRFLRNTGLINIVSIIVLILTFIQYNSARNEKKLAQKAQESAEAALEKVKSLRDETIKITTLSTELTYLENNNYTIYADGGIEYSDVFYEKLDSLMILIKPNENEKKKWIEELSNSK